MNTTNAALAASTNASSMSQYQAPLRREAEGAVEPVEFAVATRNAAVLVAYLSAVLSTTSAAKLRRFIATNKMAKNVNRIRVMTPSVVVSQLTCVVVRAILAAQTGRHAATDTAAIKVQNAVEVNAATQAWSVVVITLLIRRAVLLERNAKTGSVFRLFVF